MNNSLWKFFSSSSVTRIADFLNKDTLIPKLPGYYGWLFDKNPGVTRYEWLSGVNELKLLYIGISPSKGSCNNSNQNLYNRIRRHSIGNASTSTLRLSLGCLLDLPLVSINNRFVFDREDQLTEWIISHAYVVYREDDAPWEKEDNLIKYYQPPLNLANNTNGYFYNFLNLKRKEFKKIARTT